MCKLRMENHLLVLCFPDCPSVPQVSEPNQPQMCRSWDGAGAEAGWEGLGAGSGSGLSVVQEEAQTWYLGNEGEK